MSAIFNSTKSLFQTTLSIIPTFPTIETIRTFSNNLFCSFGLATDPLTIQQLKTIISLHACSNEQLTAIQKACLHPLLSTTVRWIKKGDWDNVIQNGVNNPNYYNVIMAAHALEDITSDEWATGLLFIDAALENKNWVLTPSPSSSISENLCYKITLNGFETRLSFPLLEMSFKDTVDDFKKKNMQKLIPILGLSSQDQMLDDLINRCSHFAIPVPGQSYLVHKRILRGINFLFHDQVHLIERAKFTDAQWDVLLTYALLFRSYLKKSPGYTIEPGGKFSEPMLPMGSTKQDEVRWVIDRILGYIIDGFYNGVDSLAPNPDEESLELLFSYVLSNQRALYDYHGQYKNVQNFDRHTLESCVKAVLKQNRCSLF